MEYVTRSYLVRRIAGPQAEDGRFAPFCALSVSRVTIWISAGWPFEYSLLDGVSAYE